MNNNKLSRLLALLILGIIGFVSYNYAGFEMTLIGILILIYWAIPIDKNN